MKILTSRTVWAVILMFVVGGLNGLMPIIPDFAVPYVDGFLGLSAIYFRANPQAKL